MSTNYKEISLNGYTFLLSYATIVACHSPGGTVFICKEKYSPSTSKHIKKFLIGRPVPLTVPQSQIDFTYKEHKALKVVNLPGTLF